MLQITPQTRIYLRQLLAAHTEKAAAVKRGAIRTRPELRALGKGKFKQLVEVIAGLLKGGEPSLFAFEGSCRHGIRASLCLRGWAWSEADRTAESVVSTALVLIGAQRPTWQQGQPEYTQDGHSPVQRTLCINCSGKLPEDSEARKFCSANCRSAYHQRTAKQFGLKQTRMEYLARVAAETKQREAQRELSCDRCGNSFIRGLTKLNQRFCSPACAVEAASKERRRLVDRACIRCGTTYRPRSEESKYCSLKCAGDAHSAAMRRPPKTCACCGQSFRPAIVGRQFCSTECRDRGKRQIPDKACANCGTMFRPRTNKGKVSEYCSKTCSGAARRKERPELTCETCSAVFRAAFASEARRFCSQTCANLANQTFARGQCASVSRFQCSPLPPISHGPEGGS